MNEAEITKTKRQLLKEFIHCYESFPCLWNIKSKEYHDREMRARAYKILVKKLQQIQPDADRSAVVRKINCLRSNLRKEYRKTLDYMKAGRVYKTKLWYYSLFHFLHGVVRRPRTETEESEEIVNLKTEDGKSDPLEWTCEIEEDPQQVDDYQHEDTTREESCEQPSPLYDVETLRLSHPGPSKPTPVNYTIQEPNYRGRLENDRHDVFGKNVAMKLRHISSTSDTQRIMAEKNINEALYMAEMGLLTMEHCKVLK